MPVSNPSDAGPLIAIELMRHTWLLTAAEFRAGTVTGTGQSLARLVDGLYVEVSLFDPVNEYAVVSFGKFVKINQWRHYGDTALTGDGRWLLEYLDVDGAWQTWSADIAIRVLSSWTAQIPLTEVICSAIRLTCTTKDSYVAGSTIKELEVSHD